MGSRYRPIANPPIPRTLVVTYEGPYRTRRERVALGQTPRLLPLHSSHPNAHYLPGLIRALRAVATVA